MSVASLPQTLQNAAARGQRILQGARRLSRQGIQRPTCQLVVATGLYIDTFLQASTASVTSPAMGGASGSGIALDMHGQANAGGGGVLYRTTGTPSPLSPTPSPAGSVGSVGSQSSGYSSGELAPGQPNGGQAGQQQQQRPQQLANSQPLAMSTPNHLNAGPCVSVPLGVHSVMQKQNQYFSYLCTCHELWEQADNLVQRAQAQGMLPLRDCCYLIILIIIIFYRFH